MKPKKSIILKFEREKQKEKDSSLSVLREHIGILDDNLEATKRLLQDTLLSSMRMRAKMAIQNNKLASQLEHEKQLRYTLENKIVYQLTERDQLEQASNQKPFPVYRLKLKEELTTHFQRTGWYRDKKVVDDICDCFMKEKYNSLIMCEIEERLAVEIEEVLYIKPKER